MPKTPIDYSKSVIYKIEHIEKPELVYVGSTTDFTKRKYNHKTSYKNENSKNHNLKLYKIIRENNGWESFKIMIICEFPCNSKTELLIEEEKHRKELQASLNDKKCYTSIEEKLQYYKNYIIEKKDKFNEVNKKYRETNRENIKEKKNIYRETNREKIKEQDKIHYEKNREQIKETRKKTMICVCNSTFRITDKSRHERSKKHINFINNNLEQCNDISSTCCNSKTPIL